MDINHLFKLLENNTGLSINRDKSEIFFSAGCSNKLEPKSILDLKSARLPVKYLELPFIVNYPKAMNFLPLIDKCRGVIEGWKSKCLSFAGRSKLIKSMITNNVMYWVQYFKIPLSINREIERICSNFLWCDKMHAWSWESICKQKTKGGMGIKRNKDLNSAASLKLI